MYKDASIQDIDSTLSKAWSAFQVFNKISLKDRAHFMRTIAREIEALGDELLMVTGRETNLPEARLRNERARTIFQLNSYADACERGDWLEVRIDTALPDRNPPKPDIRKMMTGIGPVVVFGAANFPYAYSTAGGDTASAFAAGCPVIVKAHPAHPQTSELMATAIHTAVKSCSLPEGVFSHIHGVSFEVGRALVEHPHTRAVGFTGSLAGGKQLFDWANQRSVPIPVFAEMSSINPVFLLPQKMKTDAAAVAAMYASSITLGVGQFCTNPGLIIGLEGNDLQTFIESLSAAIEGIAPGTMLHAGIAENYRVKRTEALAQSGVEMVAVSGTDAGENQGVPTIAKTSAQQFLQNPVLHREVFGPYSLVIACNTMEEMLQVARVMEGQLTATMMATEEDIVTHTSLTEAIMHCCGRFILNSVPTGVEVCMAMQHGGPYPATTDSRFGAVGADAIKRFVRPLAFQNWPDGFLPPPLQNSNPMGIWRMVNDQFTNVII
ncbi:MAG: aldehyde dehydrogenase (NADP(+)) [Bacteroidetes bacterium]|nr:aldehyde dehydrogenase (NADP(+)) [Bacteroidota bacterium]